jgi:tRNA modification GTPase
VTFASRAVSPDDTIVAIATAPGTGPIGIIRVSGPRAVELTARIARVSQAEGIEAIAPRIVHRALIVDPDSGAALDDGLVVKMLAPRSYTGEDLVELSGHGNPVLLAEILQLLLAQGARLADPGEFTRRAFLNGRIDLVQVEAVAELIQARSERAIRLATRQLRGALSAQIGAIRGELVDLMAGLEVALDFPEEEIGLSRAEGVKRILDLAGRVEHLRTGARQRRAVQDGLAVMLAGSPNAGKSSLFNALLERDRAIVSPLPGTTRDLVDGSLLIGGVVVRLMDGAGLGRPSTTLDAEGMRRTRQAVEECDLVLVVLDGSRSLSTPDHEVLALTAGKEKLVVANKSDLPAIMDDTQRADVTCSALTGAGLGALRGALERWVERRTDSDADEGGVTASLRVLDKLETTSKTLRNAADVMEDVPIEAVLVDLRGALAALEATLGLEADDAVLDRIFSRFCVGK